MQLKRILAGAVMSFVVTGSLALSAPAAFADSRDDAVAAQEEADQKIDELRDQLEGLDANLADVYLELEKVNQQLPVVQTQLAQAQEAADAAKRRYDNVKGQLNAAEGERDRLNAEIAAASDEEEQLDAALGALSRDLYRGDSPSALSLIMTAQNTEEIEARASSAMTMSRTQTQALDSVREKLAINRNQVERKQAAAERILKLEEEAAEAMDKAQSAQQGAQKKLQEVQGLKSSLVKKQKDWDSKKAAAKKQLDDYEQKREEAARKVAKIDQENRENNVVFDAAPAAPTASTPAPARNSGALFSKPLRGAVITSPFGYRIHPIFGYPKLHDGVDFGVDCGTPQYAAREGVVTDQYFDSGGGNMVFINHGMINGSSWSTQHLHLQSAAVSVGQHVDSSTIIGYTGSTGNSTGCHSHFSVLRDGEYVNPLDYM